jgi:hypothetical protein
MSDESQLSRLACVVLPRDAVTNEADNQFRHLPDVTLLYVTVVADVPMPDLDQIRSDV